MSTVTSQRLMELLAGEAAGDLAREERDELALAAPTTRERDAMMRIAALAQIAFLGADRNRQVHLYPALEARLKKEAARWSGGSGD